MSKMTNLLQERFQAPSNKKVKELAKKSSEGILTSFHGLFQDVELSSIQKNELLELLERFQIGNKGVEEDFQELLNITSEVRAISNQAAILHGERIKRAQTLLKRYKDGAFSQWLVTTYGNRQTPYNFLLYYEFFSKLSGELQKKLEIMPRQAVYVLASRDAEFSEKEKIVSSYNGETKNEMLEKIRDTFPLNELDKRKPSPGQKIIAELTQLLHLYQKEKKRMSTDENELIEKLLSQLIKSVR